MPTASCPEAKTLARAVERDELLVASQADLVLTHSSVEAGILRKHIPHCVRVVPFAAGERKSPPAFADRRGIAFLGSFGHTPNADAAYWLASEILPLVWAQAPGA